jgi:DNA-binding NtrC family response regulator
LLLTDLTMPDMSGLQLAQSAQQIRQHLPVVLMSGYDEIVTDADRDASHLCDLIIKPFSVSSLGWLLRRVLAHVKSPAPSESNLPLLSQG